MKKLFPFILYFCSFLSLGQTSSTNYKIVPGVVLKSAEQEFVVLVNEYRKQNGLKPVILSNKYYEDEYNQSYYLSHLNEYSLKTGNSTLYISHGQEKELPGFTRNTTRKEKGFAIYKNASHFGECVMYKFDWLFEWNKRNEKEIALEILNSWKKSPKHNAILLVKDFNKLAISCYRTQIIDYIPPNQNNYVYKCVIWTSCLVMWEEK